MDDSECVCPLCCEELDISDRQFFPCKCGYQVCMWCWHRIRETESGLCPACRTPYGDDPHEFSAVDVEEVLKANKEKEAAAKREREKQRQGGPSDGNSAEVETLESLLGSGKKGQMEVPKDRNQLANMRVIRRNLVYAVGLPQNIATEEILKRPEYFGQYGKTSKIVVNRSQTTAAGDPRRASASAYCTFIHKEDTLACILALDGFFMDGRNIRASYGTSKYCSAFIKNVRCSNPECTYLHEMGDVEDTFTKQEIQAGYVTSGRDVLARQQQIVEEALGAAAGGASRRRVGGGGPSGTGRAANNPIFPPPSFDEPAKQPAPLVPPPPGSAARSASVNSTSAFPTIAAANASVPAPSMVSHAASVGAVPKSVSMNSAAAVSRKSAGQGATPLSAASVVAGSRVGSTPPAARTTLTPLTPLKRTSGKGSTKPEAAAPSMPAKLPNIKTGKSKNGIKIPSSASGGSPASAGSSHKPSGRTEGPSLIGGAVIAAPAIPVAPVPSSLASLGGEPLSGLGGEVFNGPLKTSTHVSSSIGNGALIGGNKDKWNPSSLGGDPVAPPGAGGLWGNSGGSSNLAPGSNNSGAVGGSVIGGGNGYQQGSGSSALASMLGINLPTGSGSLRESSDLWGRPMPPQQTPISGLNGSALPSRGVIGPGISNQSNGGLIGGLPIGAPPMGQHPVGGGGNNNDIALLQSLLPGVHITSGSSYGHGNGFGAPGQPQRQGNPGMQQPGQWNSGLQTGIGGPPIGAVGQGAGKRDQRQAPGNIW